MNLHVGVDRPEGQAKVDWKSVKQENPWRVCLALYFYHSKDG